MNNARKLGMALAAAAGITLIGTGVASAAAGSPISGFIDSGSGGTGSLGTGSGTGSLGTGSTGSGTGSRNSDEGIAPGGDAYRPPRGDGTAA